MMTQALNGRAKLRQGKAEITDDTILWQGTREMPIRFGDTQITQTMVGLGALAFGVAIFVTGGASGILAGLVLICIGPLMAFSWALQPLLSKGKMHYTVTRTRACVSWKSLFGRQRQICVRMSKRTSIEVVNRDPPAIKIECSDGMQVTFDDVYEAHQVVADLKKIQRDVL